MDGPDPREAFESSVRGLTNPRAGFAAETLTLLRLATWLGQATAAERGITPDPPAHWGSLIGALLISEAPACRWLQAAPADSRLDATRFLPASRRYRREALAAAQRGEAAPAPSGRWFSPSLTAQITAARDDARRVGSAGLPELRPVHLLAGAILAPVGDHAREVAGALANLPALQAHLRVWVADAWETFSDTGLARFGFEPSDTPTVWPWTSGPAPDGGRTPAVEAVLKKAAGWVKYADENSAPGAVLAALGQAPDTGAGAPISDGEVALARLLRASLPFLGAPPVDTAPGRRPQLPPGASAGATLLERACRLATRVGPTPAARTLGLRHLLGAALATAEDLPPSFHALPPLPGDDPDAAMQDLRLDFLALVAKHHKDEDRLDAWAEAILGERIARTAPAGDHSPSRDLLGFTRYARAFASVIADTAVTPPLAIGLFGAWGSGKSAMMAMIARELARIEARAVVTDRQEFCRGIVAVEFNAWHYAEANLWASLFVRIMEVLDTHLSPATPPAIAEQYQALVRELDAKDAESGAVAAQAEIARRAAAAAQAEADAARTAKDTALAGARRLAAARADARQDAAGRDIRREAKDLLDDADATLRALGLDARARELAVAAAGEDGRQVVARLAGLQAEIVEAGTHANTVGAQLARIGVALSGPRRWQVIASGLLPMLVAIALLTGVGAGDLASVIGGSVSLLAGPLLIAATQWDALRGALAQAPVLARRLADGVATLDARIGAREDAANAARDGVIEMEARTAAAAEIRAAEDLAREAGRLQEEAERLKAEAETARAAAALLRARLEASAPSRLLADFVRDRAGSEEYGRALGLPTRIRRDITALREKLDALKTQKDAPRRADRIVLFIDDLDRCKPEVVVRVLEAVNILLTFDLFVVVVGVDMAWLDRALAVHHAQLIEAGAATPQDYMEKIFQVPFWVPAMDAGGRASLLHAALPLARAEPVAVPGASAGGTARIAPSAPLGGPPPEPTPPPPAPLPSLDPVRLSAEERTDLLRIGALAGETPRRLKRFARSYLILRASLAGQRLEDLAAANTRSSHGWSPPPPPRRSFGRPSAPQSSARRKARRRRRCSIAWRGPGWRRRRWPWRRCSRTIRKAPKRAPVATG